MGAQHLLVVENDPDDALLIRKCFSSLPQCGTCFVCRNASEARAYLLGAGMYADREKYPIPVAIISDLRMPGETGLELLRWIKGQQALASVSVIVLTSFGSPAEMETALRLGATKFLQKPADLEEFRELLLEVAHELCAERGSSRHTTPIKSPSGGTEQKHFCS
jgi:CheY-like chemotaxis protein